MIPGCTAPGKSSSLERAVAKAGGELVPCGHNPVDAVWTNRPPPPLSPVRPHGLEHAGESSSSKIERIAEILADKDCAAAVISDPTSIAWLLNIRGGDLPGTPVCLGFAVVRKEGTVTLYTDRRKVHARSP